MNKTINDFCLTSVAITAIVAFSYMALANDKAPNKILSIKSTINNIHTDNFKDGLYLGGGNYPCFTKKNIIKELPSELTDLHIKDNYINVVKPGTYKFITSMRFTSDKRYTEEEGVKIHVGLFVNDMMYRKYVSIHNEETYNQETELYLKQNDKISLVTILETRLSDDEKFGKEMFNTKLSDVSFDLFTDIIS